MPRTPGGASVLKGDSRRDEELILDIYKVLGHLDRWVCRASQPKQRYRPNGKIEI